jgi:hypothetical protein
MRLDSAQVLGSQQLAGAMVTARGSGLRHAARVSATGLVGAVALEYAAARYTARRPSQTPKFGHTAFLAVNEREVALLKAGGGSWEFEVSPFVRSMIVRIVRALGY